MAEDEQAEKRLAEWGGRLLKAEKIKAVVQSARTTRGVPVGVGDGYHLAEIAGRLLESKRRLETHHRGLEKSSAGLRAVTLAGEALGQATTAVLHLACGDPAGYGSGGAYPRFREHRDSTPPSHKKLLKPVASVSRDALTALHGSPCYTRST